MRFVVTSLVFLSILIISCVDQPRRYALARTWIVEHYHSLAYDKQIIISGQQLLSEEEVRKILPAEKPVSYWLLNGPVIESSLLQNPRIQHAAVSRCSLLSWSCFQVRVEERLPAFFAVVGNKGWMVGADGGVIKPVAARRPSDYVPAGPGEALSSEFIDIAARLRIPVVSGLLVEQDSPDMVRARFEQLKRALDVIEEESGLRVSYLEPGVNKSISVRFFDLYLTARFELDPQDLWKEKPEELADRARRLKKLLEEFGDKKDRIATVDLGFEKIAVVNTR